MLPLLAALVFAPESILAVDGQVIGSRVAGRWRKPDVGFARRHKSVALYPFGLGRAETRPVFYSLDRDGSDGPTILGGEDEVTPTGAMLGGLVPRAPRPVHAIPPSPVYEQAARRFLAARGISVVKARVTRVLRVDLDGDGTDEAIVEATNGEIARGAAKSAYSLVLLRALRAGKVVETPLDFYPLHPGGRMLTTKTVGIADLDGDGRMEIVVSDAGIDESGAVLWGYRAGRATKLLENGSGV